MTNTSPEPDDILGTRPAGEGPRTFRNLLRETLDVGWSYGLTILALSIFGAILRLVIAAVFVWASQQILSEKPMHARPWWLEPGLGQLGLLPTTPLLFGYLFAILHLARDSTYVFRRLFEAFRSWRLFLNVFTAGAILTAAPYLVFLAWNLLIPWQHLGEISSSLNALFESDRFGALFFNFVPQALGSICALPVLWGGLDVLALEHSLGHALVRSMHSVRANPRLVSAYIILGIITMLISSLAGAGRLCLLFPVALALTVFIWPIATALIYREFVWREREAGQASAAPLG